MSRTSSIICSSLENFRKVLKKLQKEGYDDGRGILDTYGISEYNWERGIRVINLYDDKSIKYAVSDKTSKVLKKDIEFLNSK